MDKIKIATEKQIRDLAYIMFQMGKNDAWTSGYSEELEKRIRSYKK